MPSATDGRDRALHEGAKGEGRESVKDEWALRLRSATGLWANDERKRCSTVLALDLGNEVSEDLKGLAGGSVVEIQVVQLFGNRVFKQ